MFHSFIFRYSLEDEYCEEGESPEVTCLVRAYPGLLEKQDLEINWVDQVESSFRLGENEELVSDIINISVKVGHKVTFQVTSLLFLSVR